jgi:hypothetical protein
MARKKHYLNNKDLLEEIRKSKEQGKLTDNAVKMFMLLSERIISRLPYANDYLREEALSGARLDLLMYWDRFDEAKSTNAFSYYSQVAKCGSARSFNTCYKYGKKFKGSLVSMDGSSSNSDSEGVYSI